MLLFLYLWVGSLELKAIDHYIYVFGFGRTSVAPISVIGVVLSEYRCVPLFVHSGLLLQ